MKKKAAKKAKVAMKDLKPKKKITGGSQTVSGQGKGDPIEVYSRK